MDCECCGENFWVDEVDKVEDHSHEKSNKVLVIMG